MSRMVKIEKKADEGMDTPSPEGLYPYGTSLTFEDKLFDELDLDKLSAGDTVIIRGTAVVNRKIERTEPGNVEKELTLQLTSVAVAKSASDDVKTLYGDE